MKKLMPPSLSLLTVFLLTFVLFFSQAPVFAETKAAERESALAAMDAYFAWVMEALDEMERDLPSIVAAAEIAADQYLKGESKLIASGDFGVVSEAVGRAGGLINFRWGSPIRDYVKDNGGRIVLLSLREDKYDEYLKQAGEKLTADGDMVVLMGSDSLLKKAKEDGMPSVLSFSNHAFPGEGFFEGPDGERVVATSPIMSMAALWVWTAEFVAACTRGGKMPPMFQSYAIEGSQERAKKYRGVLFEETAPPPVEPEKLGRQFLAALRDDLKRFYEAEREQLLQTILKLEEVRQAGGNLYTFLHGHSTVMHQVEYPANPGVFTQINRDWFRQSPKIDLEKGDAVLCIGYSQRFHDGDFEQWDDKAREAGATLIWSFAGFNPEEKQAVLDKGEMFIEQHWKLGDVSVELPGYDVKLFPTSGVIAQLVLRLVEAGLYSLQSEDTPSQNQPKI